MAHRQLPQYVTHLLSAMPTNYNLLHFAPKCPLRNAVGIIIYLPAMESCSTSTQGLPKVVLPIALGRTTLSETAVMFLSIS